MKKPKKRKEPAKPQPGKVPMNAAERRAYLAIAKKGWIVTKRGWPDLACFDADGNLVAVECKKHGNQVLKECQSATMKALEKAGVRCFRYDPETGFTRYSEESC